MPLLWSLLSLIAVTVYSFFFFLYFFGILLLLLLLRLQLAAVPGKYLAKAAVPFQQPVARG